MTERGFRQGESSRKPWGGNVADEPLPKALHAFAISRGLESQGAFARSLAINQSTVGQWNRGETAPSPFHMSNIFLVHKPNSEEVESLIEPWGILLQEGKGIQSHKRLEISIKLMHQSKTPIGRWLQQNAIEHKMTLVDLGKRLEIRIFYPDRDHLGIEAMMDTIERAPRVLELDETKTAELVEAVAQTIEEKAALGHKFKRNSHDAKNAQKGLAFVTYTPKQAADEFGITREAVRQKRIKLGLALVMDEKQMEILRGDFEATRVQREKALEARKINSRLA